MATIEKCERLAAKFKAANMEYDFERLKALSDEKVDEELAEIAACTAGACGVRVGNQEMYFMYELNHAWLEMACRLTVQECGILFATRHPTEFADAVKALYDLLARVEAQIGSRPRPGPKKMAGVTQ